MGLMDAFGAETRVEITVRELTALLKGKAKAEADFNAAMVMLREVVDPETVRAVFGFEPEEKEPATAATAADPVSSKDENNLAHTNDNTKAPESQALKAAKAKLLAIYETLSPEECRAWEMGEVYAEVVRGCGE
ncbi:MAG: hypothetical protein IJL33_03515 [Ruminococcus sp.]|uniref:hypothetical protein n=1 Tax=Ruminococcus sp. TaxID=41978 RepID=UPI0025FFFC46|nr:hypothetical protein [Ruminococcus sp.]MBQ6034547.1 hypothetical protein [Ruminococcus sp.]MBR0530016.1 hypothetical protein [Ruminococcus sp.]